MTRTNRQHEPHHPTFVDALDGYRLEDTWSDKPSGRHHLAEAASAPEWPARLEVETLVSTSAHGLDHVAWLGLEQRSVVELCRRPRSVAEVASVLRLPWGSTRGLLVEMAEQGLVTVHRSIAASGGIPDLAWMERVLSGLREI
ncbi:DUF742 domain-containing protein [Pseudonocardia acaciae]|uniref:DUF742 domain-containing protein n=1 Tax=Pseudonocardia acaciae TaxID=551276 RepID=UPI00068754EC|nr:DUF742 domain-containing protein [Pseudonocardia acaciae]